MRDPHDSENTKILKHGAEVLNKQKEEPPEVCDICGGKMERDPESGELYCPDCYYSENQG
jgi:uncharacterized Zn finger protein (UPF0148 family)